MDTPVAKGPVFVTSNASDAVAYLFGQVLPRLRDANRAEIHLEYEKSCHAWSSRDLLEGTEAEIRLQVTKYISRWERRNDFDGILVSRESGEASAWVGTLLTFPYRLMPLRVWRCNKTYFACGNSSFG